MDHPWIVDHGSWITIPTDLQQRFSRIISQQFAKANPQKFPVFDCQPSSIKRFGLFSIEFQWFTVVVPRFLVCFILARTLPIGKVREEGGVGGQRVGA